MSNVIANIAIMNSLLIEVPISRTPAAGDEYTFRLNDTIVKAEIYGIELVTATQLAVTPSGNPVIAESNAPNISITLVEQRTMKQFTQDMPGTRLVPSLYQGLTQIFKPRKIDTTKTKVRINNVGTLAIGQSIVLQLYYNINPDKEV